MLEMIPMGHRKFQYVSSNDTLSTFLYISTLELFKKMYATLIIRETVLRLSEICTFS